MKVQERVQQRVEEIAADHMHANLYTDYFAANVGVWRFYSQDDFEQIAHVTFRFNLNQLGGSFELSAPTIDYYIGTYPASELGQALTDLFEFLTADA